MFDIPNIGDSLEILTDEVVKNFLVKNFSEYFKSIKEEQNLRKVTKSLYIFLTYVSLYLYIFRKIYAIKFL